MCSNKPPKGQSLTKTTKETKAESISSKPPKKAKQEAMDSPKIKADPPQPIHKTLSVEKSSTSVQQLNKVHLHLTCSYVCL